MDSTNITREIFWNVPAWAHVLMYVLFVVAVSVCAYRLRLNIRSWRRGRRSGVWPRPGVVLRRLLKHAVLQVKIWRSPAAGISHACIFWGFIVLFIGTCIVAVEDYGSRMLGVEQLFFYGNFYLVVSCALEVFGVAFLYGLALALARRRAPRRSRPLSRGVDHAILWLFMVIGVTGFLQEGLRIAGTEGEVQSIDFERWSFIGWSLARLFSSVDHAVVLFAHQTVWVVHMVLSMGFIAMIPYCKLRHILVAPLQVALAEPRPIGKLTAVSMEEVEQTGKYGVTEVGDFKAAQLFSFDACTECARCQNVCPAFVTDKPLSPMRVVLDIARLAEVTDASPAEGASGGSSPAAGDRGEKSAPALHGETIDAEVLWSCTTCGACVYECPVMIDQLEAIVDMRRSLVGEGEIRGSAQTALRSIASAGNPWGMPQDERLAWAGDLKVPTLDDEPRPELLFWVGCAGSYDRRSQKVTRAMVKILRAAGVRFAVLGKKERCTGDPARRLGDEFTFSELASGNVETLKAAGIQKVMTTCPHCFNSFKNEYPELGGTYETIHHTQLIEELLAAGKIQLDGTDRRKIAYHDPCYLGRQNGVYEAPRQAMKAAGAEVLDPEQSRDRGFCCGAGGGRMWMEETVGARINSTRFEQLEVLEPEVIGVACPFCMTMMTDAAAEKDSSIEVKDVAEVVAEQLKES